MKKKKNDKYELSDISKAFLNSYLDDGNSRPELSDFSKAYMTSISDDFTSETTTNNERPALSGLTMGFLKDNEEKNENNKKEEIIEEKDE